MEDPTHFDIWGIVQKGANEDAVQWILVSKTWRSPLEIRKVVNFSTAQQQPILIIERKRWSEVEGFRQNCPEWLESFDVFQEGYTPSNKHTHNYCSLHDLYYGGMAGCHVCTGFYVP